MRLSPSTIMPSRFDTVNSLNNATTEMGSVAASMAAVSRPTCHTISSWINLATGTKAAVVSNMPMMTPGMARNRMACRLLRKDLRFTWNAASNSRMGRKTCNSKSGLSLIFSRCSRNPGAPSRSRLTAKPATTSSTV